MLFIVAGVGVVAGTTCVLGWLCYITGWTVDVESEKTVAAYLRCVDIAQVGSHLSDEEYAEMAEQAGLKSRRFRLNVNAAVACKAHFGLLPENQANKDLISDWVRQTWCQRQKLSARTISGVDPIATVLAFVPSSQEIAASHERARTNKSTGFNEWGIQTEKQVQPTSAAIKSFSSLLLLPAARESARIHHALFARLIRNQFSAFDSCSLLRRSTIPKELAHILNTNGAAGMRMTFLCS